MTIDYRKLFEAFRRYIDRTLDEMRRCDILRERNRRLPLIRETIRPVPSTASRTFSDS